MCFQEHEIIYYFTTTLTLNPLDTSETFGNLDNPTENPTAIELFVFKIKV